MITIYHQKRIEGQHLWDPRDPEPAPWPERYEKVAMVNIVDLDRAWELTNTIDAPWPRNKEVRAEPGRAVIVPPWLGTSSSMEAPS